MSALRHCFALIALATIVSTGDVALASAPASGFIHGTVTTHSGKQYEGFLRWDAEEAFWDDLFHSARKELPWFEYVDEEVLEKEYELRYNESRSMIKRIIRSLGGDSHRYESSRIFVCRFGDLERLEISHQNEVLVWTGDGSRHRVSGYSNDVGGPIVVYSSATKTQKLSWEQIASIDFNQAPTTAVPYAERLYGTVETSEGEFAGYIQWDKSECTTTDVLDGTHKGRDMEIEMGRIHAIIRRNSRSAKVELIDGDTFVLEGTNDVNADNRGIMVEKTGVGRVTIPWQRFKRVVFTNGRGSGPDRASFAHQRALRGTVVDQEGQQHYGRLVYDLDEAWSWDIYNGRNDKLEWDIPFASIASVKRDGHEHCQVTLLSGETLRLGGSQDPGPGNDGLLVFADEHSEPRFVPWRLVSAVRFEH